MVSYQRLVLELPARVALETEVVGRVSYADLDLRPKCPRDNKSGFSVAPPRRTLGPQFDLQAAML